MNTKNYSLQTITIYFIVFFAPLLSWSLSSSIWMTVIGYFLGAIVMGALYFQSKPIFSFERKEASIKKIVLLGISGIFMALILQMVVLNIESFFGGSIESGNTNSILEMIQLQPQLAIAAMIAGPIMEEFVFRRALIGIFSKKMPFFVSAILSALLFALIHGDGHLLLYGSLGLFFSWEYAQTGRIWTSIITHVGMNSFVIMSAFQMLH